MSFNLDIKAPIIEKEMGAYHPINNIKANFEILVSIGFEVIEPKLNPKNLILIC